MSEKLTIEQARNLVPTAIDYYNGNLTDADIDKLPSEEAKNFCDSILSALSLWDLVMVDKTLFKRLTDQIKISANGFTICVMMGDDNKNLDIRVAKQAVRMNKQATINLINNKKEFQLFELFHL